jgi:hypothetical protein
MFFFRILRQYTQSERECRTTEVTTLVFDLFSIDLNKIHKRIIIGDTDGKQSSREIKK